MKIFRLSLVCRLQSIGIGKSKIMRSITTLETALPSQTACVFSQWPEMVGSHDFWTGIHSNTVEMSIEMIQARTTPWVVQSAQRNFGS